VLLATPVNRNGVKPRNYCLIRVPGQRERFGTLLAQRRSDEGAVPIPPDPETGRLTREIRKRQGGDGPQKERHEVMVQATEVPVTGLGPSEQTFFG